MDKKEMPKIFTIEEIESFIRVHFQSKIDHRELEQMGFDMKNVDNFEKQFEFYTRALFEGICNGILMCGGKIEGVDDGES